MNNLTHQFQDTALLRSTSYPSTRWALTGMPVGTNAEGVVAATFSLRVQNLSDDVAADFKIQAAVYPTSGPASENDMLISIPDPDAAWADGAVKMVDTYGGFNSTFTDVSGQTGLTIAKLGIKSLIFTVLGKAFVQIVPTSASNARLLINGHCTQPMAIVAHDHQRASNTFR